MLRSSKSQHNSASKMTCASGISNILPGSDICDFQFDPCGYSMNAIEGPAMSTIHVTPEDGFSYASFEAMGYDPGAVNMNQLIARVLACFQPREISVAIHSDLPSEGYLLESGFNIAGYISGAKSYQELGNGGSLVFQSFRISDCGSPRSILKGC